MSTTFIVPQNKNGEHREKLHKKHCAFSGCRELFMGTGKSKYCTEHRKRKYRKIIDANKVENKKIKQETNNPNQTIKHEYTDNTLIEMVCALDGCHSTFKIQMLPHTFVYPKYCEAHRNEYKRQYFLNERTKAKEIQM